MSNGPRRAHEFTVRIGADTRKGLVDELLALARRIERDEITCGVMGGSTAGATYSYIHDPSITHDRYFEEINGYLESLKQNLQASDHQS